jgi:transposase
MTSPSSRYHRQSGMLYREIAEKHGVSYLTAYETTNGKRWAHIQ